MQNRLSKKIVFLDNKKSHDNKRSYIKKPKTHKAELTKFGIQHIGLFGSYARDEQSKKSDIDILIDFDPDKESFDNYMAVYYYFERLLKDEKIEIVTRKGLSPHIGRRILKEVM